MNTSNFTKKLSIFRDFLHTITQRTYPFREVAEDGKKIYLDKAYARRWDLGVEEFGEMPNMKCKRIFLWREFLHLWTSIFFWFLALTIHYFFSTPVSLFLPIALLLFFTVKEFYLDRVKYQQKWGRAVIDWLIWGLPLILFFVINVF